METEKERRKMEKQIEKEAKLQQRATKKEEKHKQKDIDKANKAAEKVREKQIIQLKKEKERQEKAVRDSKIQYYNRLDMTSEAMRATPEDLIENQKHRPDLLEDIDRGGHSPLICACAFNTPENVRVLIKMETQLLFRLLNEVMTVMLI
jgi:hypothetical protein